MGRDICAADLLGVQLVQQLLLLAFVLATGLLGRTTYEGLLWGMLASAAGILIFLYRRERDLGALARADDWREEALRGRGMTLADWRAGKALAGWNERRDIG